MPVLAKKNHFKRPFVMNHHQTSSKNCSRRIAGALVLLTTLATAPQLIAQDQPKSRELNAEWQRDLLAFDKHVKGIATKARIPTAEEFRERMENAENEDEEFFMFPMLGVADLKPAEGTVQFELNEALKGKAVRWEMELALDDERFGGALLSPKRLIGPWEEAIAEGKPLRNDSPLVLKVQLTDKPGLSTRLFAGQQILLEGTVGGVAAWYNWNDIPGLPKGLPLPITFWVMLEDFTVTRIDPTEEQLKDQVLSGKADLDRKDWKVLEVNGGSEFAANAAGRAIDSDFDTAWQTGGENGQLKHPHSLLVDMGHEETVAGLRYGPPGASRSRDRFSNSQAGPTGGRVGKFSLHVSNSREDLGEPVCSATFTNYPVEHEVAFPEVKGRYFKFVVHSSADGASPTAVAELNLLAPAVEIPDPAREPALPPMAEEFERFALLYGKLGTLPRALELPEDHPILMTSLGSMPLVEPWWNLKGEIYGMAARIAKGDESVEEEIYRVAETGAHSQFGWANVLTVAASPRFSTEEEREEMATLARRMKAKRLEVLAGIKRTLSVSQQEKLKAIVSKLAPTPPRPRATSPVRVSPQAQANIELDKKGAGSFLEMLAVGHAGNEPDRRTTFGAIDYPYAIGKYEVTNEQYAEFLNEVAAADPNALYNEKMGSDRDGGIVREGEPGGYRYSVKDHRGNKPVVFVSWFDALRFCNWLHNGRPDGAQDRNTTEAGAYTLTGATRIAAGTDPVHGEHGRNAGARFWLPSEDEWYKAAYRNPKGDGKSAPKFWLYPTKSDQPPTTATADETGNIDNDTPNIANAPQPPEEGEEFVPPPPPPAPLAPEDDEDAPPPGPAPPAPAPPAPVPPAPAPPVQISEAPAPPAPAPAAPPSRPRPPTKLTTVGSGGPGSESSYGAADMAGNVEEWTQDIRGKGRMRVQIAGGGEELWSISDHASLEDVLDTSVTHRRVRGGSWRSPSLRSTDREEQDPDIESSSIGFRVAGPKSSPGPRKD